MVRCLALGRLKGVRSLVFLFALFFACAGGIPVTHGQATPEPTLSYLPQVANGEFGSNRFRTTFVLTNTASHPVHARIDLTLDDASPLVVDLSEGAVDLGNDSSFTVMVPGIGTRFLDTSGVGGGQVGAARVTSDEPISVAAVFTILDGNGSLITETGVGDSQPQTSFVLPVDRAGTFSTALALFNADASQASQLTLRLYDLAGQATGSPAQMTLQALEHRAKFVHEFFSNLGDFRGTLHVSADRPVSALTLRQNFQPLGLTTLPVVPTNSAQTDFILPHVADGAFPGGRIRTSFLLFALSSVGASAKMTLTRDDGQPLEMPLTSLGTKSELDLTIGPNGSTFLESTASGALTSGAVRVVSDQPIGIVALFSVLEADGKLRTEAGVAAAKRQGDLSVPVSIDTSFETGIAFFNPNEVEATVVLALLAADGTSVTGGPQVTLKLPPRGHSAQFVSELFSGISLPFRGSVGVLVSKEISAVALRQNNAPLSFTTLPVADQALIPMRGDGVVINEVGFIPAAGQFPYVELKATQDGAWPAGLVLENEAAQQFRLPDSLPALSKGQILMVTFDGANSVDGLVVHADRTGFLHPASGVLILVNNNGQHVDRVRWGAERADSVMLGRGGLSDDPVEGMSIGRIPAAATLEQGEDWISYSPSEATPGLENRRPRVEVLIPFSGAISPEPTVGLSWYPVPGVRLHRVQIARDSEFSQIVLDQVVEAGELTTPPLTAGNYLWRVQAIDSDQVPADFSDPVTLTIDPSFAVAGQAQGVGIAQAGKNPLGVPLISQRKDTRMLLLESLMPWKGEHKWDTDHRELDKDDPADQLNCGLASVAMVNAWFQIKAGSIKRLSQDRIGYEIFKDRVEGPEWDLSYQTGLDWRKGQSSQQTRALRWALGAGASATFKPFSTGDEFWNDIVAEIDAERPLLVLTTGKDGKNAHTMVITGYTVKSDGARVVIVNNPWHYGKITPVFAFYADRNPISPQLPDRIWGAYWVLGGNIAPRSDEDSIRDDSDGDGVYDFDEQFRFGTKWQKAPEDADTDRDEVRDKEDIYASVYDESVYAYSNRAKARTLKPPLSGDTRPRIDKDALPFELDSDSDGGGCYDGFEDFNHDGKRQKNLETSNYDKKDDKCHVKGGELRVENYRLFETPSSKAQWQSTLAAGFCLGPLAPAQRSDASAIAGRGMVNWVAYHVVDYSQVTGSGCTMPLKVVNTYRTVLHPVDTSGSVGPGPTPGSITLAFYPRPNSQTVTASYSETPACDFLEDKPMVWPESSALWGGIGWFGPPFNQRVTVPAGGARSVPTPYTVPQPGEGRSTLRIWFVPRPEELASLPCQP
ncbi:MAG: hypothetical protein EHM61_22605 [Acidobacteria bacterium]|nr:MAG: hypothetical protein EHM61_22605 [Acidobacteriota bacterium]